MLLTRLYKLFSCISAWASALLVSTTKQCQSFYAWDEQKRGSHAFSLYSSQQKNQPRAKGISLDIFLHKGPDYFISIFT